LGRQTLVGQLSEIALVENFISDQIDIAEEEQKKNAKLYKSLGIIVGLGVVIILI